MSITASSKVDPSNLRATSLQRVGFYVLHAMLFLLTAMLLLMAYMAARAYQFPGLLFFIPPLIILLQTAPRLQSISVHKESLRAIAITTLPLLAFIILMFAIPNIFDDMHTELYLYMALSVLSVFVATVSYRQFKRIIAQPAPWLASTYLRSKPFYVGKTMLIFKILFVILFVAPVMVGVTIGFANVISNPS